MFFYSNVAQQGSVPIAAYLYYLPYKLYEWDCMAKECCECMNKNTLHGKSNKGEFLRLY
jgi:hypothetical protein